jgi:hypothetical protein
MSRNYRTFIRIQNMAGFFSYHATYWGILTLQAASNRWKHNLACTNESRLRSFRVNGDGDRKPK